MTFEQQFKKAFKSDLEAILGGKFKLYTTNDITFKNYNKGDILAVIKTGQGTTSGVENVLATNIITTITFKCESIFLQEVLSILNEYVNNINGKYFETEDGIIFKLGLNTPYTIGSPIVENVGNDSIYTSICQLAGNVFYSNLAKPSDKFLYFGEEKVKIEGIQNFQDNTVYNFQLSDGTSDEGVQSYNGLTRTITISFYNSNNTFCNYLKTINLAGKIFKFQKGEDETINVVFNNKVLIEQNGVEIYTIVLGVVD